MQTSLETLEREHAEVEQGLKSLEEQAGGQSLIDILSLQDREFMSLSPPPPESLFIRVLIIRESMTPRSEAPEGLIEGIVEPDEDHVEMI